MALVLVLNIMAQRRYCALGIDVEAPPDHREEPKVREVLAIAAHQRGENIAHVREKKAHMLRSRRLKATNLFPGCAAGPRDRVRLAIPRSITIERGPAAT